jgi:leucyl-tRNA synthetase
MIFTMKKYDHKEIENKWQKKWEKSDLYRTPKKSGKNKRYVLDMFPYPSGAGLHVGHVKGYTATDIYSRYLRMSGYDVLHPMGWDAFGLPAENYAVKTGVHPKKTTESSIANFKKQISSLGFSYDWSREINTSLPDYYRWTQWLFLLMYKNGLAYKKNAPVNWCPDCQTVLANEQVVDGECERCGFEVIQKEMQQWFFRITDYAEDLIKDLDNLTWPESTKIAQKNWIGKSDGAEIQFGLNRKLKYVLLHGYKSSPQKNFHPWLKEELEKNGHEVVVPALPNPDDPDVNQQASYVLKNISFDKDTVLVAHSLGSIVAYRVLEKVPNVIHKLVLVGGFIDKYISVEKDKLKSVDYVFDKERIKKHAGKVEILRPVNDSAIPIEQALKIQKAIGGDIIDFKANDDHARGKKEPEVLKACLPNVSVFTTRPDTLYGATYMVIAPEHTLIQEHKDLIVNFYEVEEYILKATEKTELQRLSESKEKTGVEISGLCAINPVNGESLPIYVADYVLASYGTGAIMAVPAHDERDHEFAKKFNLEIRQVIASDSGDGFYTGEGELVNSEEQTGLQADEAKEELTKKAGGVSKTTYKLRDWLVSRQRYWGPPIPIVYDPDGNAKPIPEEHLPWLLPTDVDFKPHGTSPLVRSKELLERVESIFGKGWTPETDTMDTFVDSSWYYFRFTDPQNQHEFAKRSEVNRWLPVDLYVGGAEHTVLHLLYARFITKVLNKLELVDFKEPFARLYHPGMILAGDGSKMSKSKGNVVNPDDVVERFGADTMRIYEMFIGPFDQSASWSTDNMVGSRRFLERVWKLTSEFIDNSKFVETTDRKIKKELEKMIQKVSGDLEEFSFNTAVSSMMIFVNELTAKPEISKPDMARFLSILAPFAPHIVEELWQKMGNENSIHLEAWPVVDEKYLSDDEFLVVVQVNGRVRDQFMADVTLSEEDIKERSLALEGVTKWVAGSEIRRIIYVKKRLVNIVL